MVTGTDRASVRVFAPAGADDDTAGVLVPMEAGIGLYPCRDVLNALTSTTAPAISAAHATIVGSHLRHQGLARRRALLS